MESGCFIQFAATKINMIINNEKNGYICRYGIPMKFDYFLTKMVYILLYLSQCMNTKPPFVIVEWFSKAEYIHLCYAWTESSYLALRWRHNERDCVSNHQPRHCLLNRLFGRWSKKTSKLRVTGLCAGNSPGTGEFPAQMASNAENVSIWWRHYGAVISSDFFGHSLICCLIRQNVTENLNTFGMGWKSLALYLAFCLPMAL